MCADDSEAERLNLTGRRMESPLPYHGEAGELNTERSRNIVSKLGKRIMKGVAEIRFRKAKGGEAGALTR